MELRLQAAKQHERIQGAWERVRHQFGSFKRYDRKPFCWWQHVATGFWRRMMSMSTENISLMPSTNSQRPLAGWTTPIRCFIPCLYAKRVSLLEQSQEVCKPFCRMPRSENFWVRLGDRQTDLKIDQLKNADLDDKVVTFLHVSSRTSKWKPGC